MASWRQSRCGRHERYGHWDKSYDRRRGSDRRSRIQVSEAAIRRLLVCPGAQDRLLEYVQKSYTGRGLLGVESLGRIPALAEQLGYGIGEGEEVMDAYMDMTPAQQEKFERRAGQTSRYGGSLGMYYDNPLLANQLTDKYNITNQGKAAGIQSLLASASEFGYTGEQVGEKAAELAQLYGSPYKAGMAGQLATSLQTQGVGVVQAMGAFGALGFQNQPQVNVAASWIQQAQMYGSTANGMDLAAASLRGTPWQSQAIGGIAAQLSQWSNADFGQTAISLGNLGLTNQQTSILGQAMGGDFRGLSWQSYKDRRRNLPHVRPVRPADLPEQLRRLLCHGRWTESVQWRPDSRQRRMETGFTGWGLQRRRSDGRLE